MSKTTVRGADGLLYIVAGEEVQIVTEIRPTETKTVQVTSRASVADLASAEHILEP